jgi:hypothetical protein
MNGYWKFNNNLINTAIDAPLNGYNVSYVTGKFAQGLSFNGTTSYCDLTNTSLYNSAPISATLWIKVSNFNSWTYQTLLHKYNVNGLRGWVFYITNAGGYKMLTNFGSAAFNASTLTGFGFDTWIHLAFTYDNNEVKHYYNGNLVNSFTIGARTIADNFRSLNVGRTWANPTPNEYFSGVMDEVTIWGRVLTAGEISTIYSSSCPITQ